MMQLYLDANVYLSFLAFSKDDLTQLGQLADLVERRSVKLILPEQTRREFLRNREAKIKESLAKLREQTLNLQFPRISEDYPEYGVLRTLQRQYEEAHSRLLESINQDVAQRNLRADKLVNRLFEKAQLVELSDDIVQRARMRSERGDPPGKKGSLGDALNWESLLKVATGLQELHFVSDDGDFASPLDQERFLRFLADEWEKEKKSSLRFYRRLSLFFRENLPQIQIAESYEKSEYTALLRLSDSFHTTHQIIAQLLRFTDFSLSEADAILRAALANNQVYWIMRDPDVKQLMERLITSHEKALDPSLVAAVRAHLTDPTV